MASNKNKKLRIKRKAARRVVERFEKLDKFISKMEEKGDPFGLKLLEAKLESEQKLNKLEDERG